MSIVRLHSEQVALTEQVEQGLLGTPGEQLRAALANWAALGSPHWGLTRLGSGTWFWWDRRTTPDRLPKCCYPTADHNIVTGTPDEVFEAFTRTEGCPDDLRVRWGTEP